MLKLWGSSPLDRRELLRVGGLALGGLSLPMLLARQATASATASKKGKSFGKAKNCIILYLSGGPAQLDTFDPKPDAPDDIRGEFGTIPTKLPGVRFSELVPRTAHGCTRPPSSGPCITSTTTTAAARTGCSRASRIPARCRDVNSMSRADMPHMGSCVAKLAPGQGPDVPVRAGAAPHGRGGRPPGRAVRRLARRQVRSAADRRQPQRRQLQPRPPAARRQRVAERGQTAPQPASTSSNAETTASERARHQPAPSATTRPRPST